MATLQMMGEPVMRMGEVLGTVLKRVVNWGVPVVLFAFAVSLPGLAFGEEGDGLPSALSDQEVCDAWTGGLSEESTTATEEDCSEGAVLCLDVDSREIGSGVEELQEGDSLSMKLLGPHACKGRVRLWWKGMQSNDTVFPREATDTDEEAGSEEDEEGQADIATLKKELGDLERKILDMTSGSLFSQWSSGANTKGMMIEQIRENVLLAEVARTSSTLEELEAGEGAWRQPSGMKRFERPVFERFRKLKDVRDERQELIGKLIVYANGIKEDYGDCLDDFRASGDWSSLTADERKELDLQKCTGAPPRLPEKLAKYLERKSSSERTGSPSARLREDINALNARLAEDLKTLNARRERLERQMEVVKLDEGATVAQEDDVILVGLEAADEPNSWRVTGTRKRVELVKGRYFASLGFMAAAFPVYGEDVVVSGGANDQARIDTQSQYLFLHTAVVLNVIIPPRPKGQIKGQRFVAQVGFGGGGGDQRALLYGGFGLEVFQGLTVSLGVSNPRVDVLEDGYRDDQIVASGTEPPIQTKTAILPYIGVSLSPFLFGKVQARGVLGGSDD